MRRLPCYTFGGPTYELTSGLLPRCLLWRLNSSALWKNSKRNWRRHSSPRVHWNSFPGKHDFSIWRGISSCGSSREKTLKCSAAVAGGNTQTIDGLQSEMELAVIKAKDALQEDRTRIYHQDLNTKEKLALLQIERGEERLWALELQPGSWLIVHLYIPVFGSKCISTHAQ